MHNSREKITGRFFFLKEMIIGDNIIKNVGMVCVRVVYNTKLMEEMWMCLLLSLQLASSSLRHGNKWWCLTNRLELPHCWDTESDEGVWNDCWGWNVGARGRWLRLLVLPLVEDEMTEKLDGLGMDKPLFNIEDCWFATEEDVWAKP